MPFSFLLLTLFAFILSLATSTRHPRAPKSTTTIPTTPLITPSIGDFTSTANSLDAPKLHPVNGTTPEWWYFDVVSPDFKTSVVITFFTATNTSFPALPSVSGVDSIYIWVSFPNGTLWEAHVPATKAVIVTDGEGASGLWEGSGFRFEGTADLGKYAVEIDSAEAGVKGTVFFSAIVPPHYPCGLVQPGQDMSVVPGIGWSNAVADAVAAVDLTVDGSPLEFKGVGYHDHNWATSPILTLFSSWYWAHLRVGPFSLVYFSVLDLTSDLHVSAYLAQSSHFLASTCSPQHVSIHPYGANATYPPHAGSGTPTGLNVSIAVPGQGVFEVVSKVEKVLVGGNGIYERWVLSATGGLKGGEVYKGVGMGEEFTLAP